MPPVLFSQTSLALRAERSARRPALALGVALMLAAWSAWMALGEIAVTATSRSAQLAGAHAPFELAARATGRLTAELPRVGERVRAGDIVVRFDDHEETLGVSRARTDLEGARAAIAPLEQEVAKLEEASRMERVLVAASQEERTAQLRRSEVEAAYAATELARAQAQLAAGALSEAELARDRATRDRLLASVDVVARGGEAAGVARAIAKHDRAAQLLAARRELADASTRVAQAETTLVAAEERRERRTLRAPVEGQIGAVGSLRPGAVVAEGVFLASIVPDGDIIVSAELDGRRYAGRIRPGMTARVRLEAYSIADHGTARARVRRVAAEAHDGDLRVELVIEDANGLPLEQGMSAVVDIVIELASPAHLVLREAGLWAEPPPRPAS